VEHVLNNVNVALLFTYNCDCQSPPKSKKKKKVAQMSCVLYFKSEEALQ